MIRKARLAFAGNRTELVLLALITLLLPIDLAVKQHTSAGEVLASESISAPLTFYKMAIRPGRATFSLDVIAINGVRTVVAGGKSRRTVSVHRADTVTLFGWAFDPAAAAPAAGVTLLVGDHVEAPSYGLARQDVAAAFKSPNLTPVGFSATFGCRDLKPGHYTLSLVVISADRKSYYRNPTNVVMYLR